MMVCPYDASRLLLILQTDHSRIAGLLAAHWGNDHFAKVQPYSSMVLAAQEHDSGWWDWEIKPSVNEQGYPSDYIGSIKHLGQGVWLDLYRRAIERIATRDLYAAYFVSMHGEALLTQGMGLLPSMPDYTGDPAVQEFIAQQKELRAGWLPTLQKNQAIDCGHHREASLVQFQSNGGFRSVRAVRLQPLSVQQSSQKKRSVTHFERPCRAGVLRTPERHFDDRRSQ